MIDSIKDAIASRMTNILLGSFIISAAAMNSRGILTFIFSEKPEKLLIIKNWQFNFTHDVLIPLFVTVIYTTAIPYISSLYKKKVTNTIYKKEQDAERDRIKISLAGMRDIARQKAETSDENADLYVKSKIEEWEREREKTISELNKHKDELQQKTNEINDLEMQANQSKEDAIYYGNLYDRAISSIKGFRSTINELIHPSPKLLVSLEEKQVEYKDHIILMLVKNLELILKDINESPSAPIKEWKPPIDKEIISTLSEYIESRKELN